MAAAAASAHPLINTSGAFARFGSLLGQGASAVRDNARAVATAARALDRLGRGKGPAGASVKQFGTGAGTAGRAVDTLGRSARTANTQLLKGRAGSRTAGRLVKDLHRQAGTGAQPILKQAKLAGRAGRLGGVLGGGMGTAAQIWDAVNLVMKGNPLILLATLIVPVAAQLIEFAMDSDAGRAFMEEVFSSFELLIGPAFLAMTPMITGLAVGAALFENIRRYVSDPVKFLREDLPKGFQHIREGMDGFFGGIAEFGKTAFQTAVGFLKVPLNGLVSFANLVIDGLNHIPGVDLPRIPMLAQGGVVAPVPGGVPVILAEAGESEVVLPLSKLDALLARTAEAARAGVPGVRGPRVEHYYEPEGRGSHGIAEDLLFLAQTRR
ncbi:hypothetical protein [Streptomyces sp. C36]|uniref:hypothetical protein n=1 Tax=Streptomyces sp. C36 TaxID=3237122 RepID=UPI0034C6909C